ncbi:hypothetical protein L596_015101 [Steinernema carpocapsae]|uniref:Uncharacterized protein n=1 Tax=Steinernema carpocapsae TaxID=34508 RepID=A0A4U5NEX5_STECR|nr:hypothetical protein L596_015101 [Steinernema carpocapsae]
MCHKNHRLGFDVHDEGNRGGGVIDGFGAYANDDNVCGHDTILNGLVDLTVPHIRSPYRSVTWYTMATKTSFSVMEPRRSVEKVSSTRRYLENRVRRVREGSLPGLELHHFECS